MRDRRILHRTSRRWIGVLIALMSFSLSALLLIFVDPAVLEPWWFTPVWPLLFLTCSSTVGVMTRSIRRGILYGVTLTLFMILRLLRVAHILEGVLLFGIAIAVDWYWSSRPCRS